MVNRSGEGSWALRMENLFPRAEKLISARCCCIVHRYFADSGCVGLKGCWIPFMKCISSNSAWLSGANTSKTPLWSDLWIRTVLIQYKMRVTNKLWVFWCQTQADWNRTVRAVRRGEAGRYLVPKDRKYIEFSRFCSQNTAFRTRFRSQNAPKSPQILWSLNP